MAPHAFPSPPLTPPTFNENDAKATPENSTYVTLITKASYLPGAIILAHSLQRTGSDFNLLVLITPSLPSASIHALRLECVYNKKLRMKVIQPLYPPTQSTNSTLAGQSGFAAERFVDTYTKLRTFELLEYEKIVFLDADILCLHNPDALFSMRFPEGTELLASPVCACNLDHDSWCPPSWRPDNCSHTHLAHPSALKVPSEVPRSSLGHSGPNGSLEPRRQLNSGVFVFHPSQFLATTMMNAFNCDPDLRSYTCPDQDFLAVFFRDRWACLPWRYNALKTMRYRHANLWDNTAVSLKGSEERGISASGDFDVVLLHYIVDKPWAARIASDGIAGHLGRDGITHAWWWNAYDVWRSDRNTQDQGSRDAGQRGLVGSEAAKAEINMLLEVIEEVVAPELDERSDRLQCMSNREMGWPKDLVEANGMGAGSRDGKQSTRYGANHQDSNLLGKG